MIRHDDPIELFQAAVNGLNARDWAFVAALCDPVSLRLFKRGMLNRFAPLQRPRRTDTVEEYLRHSPDMPREVAEYNVAQQAKYADIQDQVRNTLPGVADVTTLAALESVDVFAAWLDGCSPHSTVERRAADGSIAAATAEKFLQAVDRFWCFLALGVIPDGDRMAHILYRDERPFTMPDSPEWSEWNARLDADEQRLIEDTAGCGNTFTAAQLCRRQPDGYWLLVADEKFLRIGNVFFAISDTNDSEDGD